MKLFEIPERGTMYALYKDKVLYQKYIKSELPEEEVLKHDLLELHLFDACREYRLINTRNGEIEAVVSDENVVYDDCYVENIFTLKNQNEEAGRVEVVNYITYDENDLVRINDYRLKEVN